MKDSEIIALANEHGLWHMRYGVHMCMCGETELIAFAKSIADIQKEKDAQICDKCHRRGAQ